MPKAPANETPDEPKEPEATKEPVIERVPVQGEWAGIPQYRCPFCPYDALYEDAVVAHIAEKHPLPPPKITGPSSPDVKE